MVREMILRWLGPPKQAPTLAELGERIDILERHLKRFEGELDEHADKVALEVKRMQALNGRVSRLLETREKPAQDDPGTTIAMPEGVQDPRQLPIPLEVQAARIRAAQARAGAAAGRSH